MRAFVTSAFLFCLAACDNPGGAPPAADAADEACLSRASDQIGGPISLTAHTGARMTEDSFKGRKTLVFFGFTYCPDVCPNTLYALGSAVSALPPTVRAPMTAFISVDPGRDTPEALSRYIASKGFPSEIIGLTGSDDELQAAARAFAASYETVEDPESAAGYLVNHTSIIYLMDENWKLETFFTPETRPDAIARCIEALDR
jgi:protein SCO1/2